MSLAHRRQKPLPEIRVDFDVDVNWSVEENEEQWGRLSSRTGTPANTNKALPSIKAEGILTEEEMHRLHELWNGAGLSARAHRRRQRGQHHIPAPISIPDPGNLQPILPSADPSTTGITPPTTGRKRWGLLSARPFSETQQAERKVFHALETLRSIAQGRLKRKLRYAKSAPNLGDKTKQPGVQPAVPVYDQAAHKEDPPISGKMETPTVLQPEDLSGDAIYFTIDPDWRASLGSVDIQSITPIPSSPDSLGRPDSPLLHRHHSLDQLAFAAQEASKTWAAVEFPGSEEFPSDAVLYEIDELQTRLELEP